MDQYGSELEIKGVLGIVSGGQGALEGGFVSPWKGAQWSTMVDLYNNVVRYKLRWPQLVQSYIDFTYNLIAV